MSDEKWNQAIRLHPFDRVFAVTFGRLIPAAVRPNHLTVFRMCLIPFVIWLLADGRYSIGVPLFLFAAITDWFDGALARTRRQVTEWGIVYDPVADKLLIGSILFVIVLQHVNYTLGLLLLAVEAGTVIVGAVRASQGRIEPANFWGKVKMVSEVLGITLLLIALWSGFDMFVDLSTGTLFLALIFALASVYTRIR